jgi:hypothetical protein
LNINWIVTIFKELAFDCLEVVLRLLLGTSIASSHSGKWLLLGLIVVLLLIIVLLLLIASFIILLGLEGLLEGDLLLRCELYLVLLERL